MLQRIKTAEEMIKRAPEEVIEHNQIKLRECLFVIPEKVRMLKAIYECLDRKRSCFKCNDDLSFIDYISTNIRRTGMDDLVAIWKNDLVEILCCDCYNVFHEEFENPDE